jgi:hypothetical protein
LFVFINLDVFSWYISEPAIRAEAGMMEFEFSRCLGTDILSFFDWGSYFLLFVLFFSKKTFLFGLVYVPFLTYIRFFTHMWDRFLYPFYIVFVLFLILREFSLFRKKKIYPMLVFVLIFFLSPISPFDRPVIGSGLDYWRTPTDGSQILYLKEFLSNKSFVIYERWPSVFSELVFSDSPSEFREFSRELDPQMSVFFRDGYPLPNISASYFLDMDRPVLFAHAGDISAYVVYLKNANMTFSRLINESFYFNLYELHFEFNQTG